MGYELNRPVLVSEFCSALSLKFLGEDAEVTNVAQSNTAKRASFCFTKEPSELEYGVIAVADCDEVIGFTAVKSTNPRLDFIRCLDWLVANVGFSTWDFESDIHPSASVHSTAFVERGCVIGPNVIIEPNVTIHSGTRIGANSRIRSNSSIGGDGFGFERLDGTKSIRFPHLGGVEIGENVEIGALNSVVRGALSDTVIGDDVKTDNLVHIAHNCLVGSGTYLTACTELSGGVSLGNNVWMGPNCSVMQKVHVGDGALVGLGAVVTKNVEPNSVVAGNPAKPITKKR